jgi:predicted membrane protein
MNRPFATRALSGIAIIAVGVSLLLNAIGAFHLDWLFETWWPMLIILAGLIIFINNARSWLVSVFLLALGGAYQLRELDYVDFEPWQVVWPLILIVVGAGLIFRRSYHGERATELEREDVTAILSGSSSANTSEHFKSSNITAIMGGAKLDLRQAKIEDGAVIEAFAFWGGIEIIVPENVTIKNKMSNIMGGTDDQTSQKSDKKSPTLILSGSAIMGGVSIRNTPDIN